MGKSSRKPKIVLVEQVGKPPKQKQFIRYVGEQVIMAGIAKPARLIFLPDSTTAKRHIRDSDIVVIPNSMFAFRKELGRRDADNKPLFTGELIFSSECNHDLCVKIVDALKRIYGSAPLLAGA